MSFIAAAQAHLATLPANCDEAKILAYLLASAQGSQNAKSWTSISTNVAPRITKEEFQQGLLSRSRSADYFIGSCGSGYFIIASQADVDVAGNYLASRVRQIGRHHAELTTHSVAHGFNPPSPI